MAKNLFRVKEINLYLQGLLAEDALLQNLWIEGEISNFKCHSSGHWYFTLKGEQSALKCVMFRQWTKGAFFLPEDGMEVRVRGSISVYERDGQYILYGEEIVSVGVGNKYLQFLALKEQLQQEGLFDLERKRPLPEFPEKIGIVTSADGAAWHDMEKIFAEKIPVRKKLFPCFVQGENSESSIIQAIGQANQDPAIAILIVSRGGGSKEDLAVFNTEGVVRAVANSKIPVVSAVGHEIDYTLTDLAADVRVPTPTAAANLVLPDKAVLVFALQQKKNQLLQGINLYLQEQKARLDQLAAACSLEEMIADRRSRLQQDCEKLYQSITDKKEMAAASLQKRVAVLNLLNPLDVLSRGYSIASKDWQGTPMKSVTEIKTGESLFLQLLDGTIKCEVNEMIENKAK